MSAESPLPADDLDRVLGVCEELWPQLRGARIFITGATGFFGRWVLESLLLANGRLGLGVRLTALSRDPGAFLERAPHLANPSLGWIRGSVASFDPGGFGGTAFDMVVHMATEGSLQASRADPQAASDVIVGGTRRALEVAARTGARRFLFTSSGAVYGPQPPGIERISEGYEGVPDPLDAAAPYGATGEAKRQAELQCLEHFRRHGLETVIARCFTFAGPALPLDSKFAFGNFMGDALRGGPIVVKGDGSAVRSYLYAADLAAWLWTLLLRGGPGTAYNVGSERALSLRQLAEEIAAGTGAKGIDVHQAPGPGGAAGRYVPSTQRARHELGLRETYTMREIIVRTASWHRAEVQH